MEERGKGIEDKAGALRLTREVLEGLCALHAPGWVAAALLLLL